MAQNATTHAKALPLAFEPPRLESAAPQLNCYDHCPICSSQWRKPGTLKTAPENEYADYLSDDQARRLIASSRDETTRNRLKVRDVVNNHGSHITQAWAKMRSRDRKSLLLAAEPEIYQDKGFPVAARLTRTFAEVRELRLPFLLPYMTLENLLGNTNNLISLIHHRLESSPEKWGAFDFEQQSVSFNRGELQPKYNPFCVFMHGPRYGELVPWDRNVAHRHSIMSFPRAQLVFEAQLVLSRFQVRVVHQILDFAPPQNQSPLGRVAWDAAILVESPPSKDALRASAFSSPPVFYLELVIDTLRSVRDAAKDDLRLIQTDPDALRKRLAKSQSFSANFFGPGKDKKAYQVNLITLAISRDNAWELLIIDSSLCYAVLKKTLLDGKGMTPDSDSAFATWEQSVEQHLKILQKQFATTMVSCPTFRKTEQAFERAERLGVKDLNIYRFDELLYHLYAIMEREATSQPLSWHFRELFRLPATDLKRLDQQCFDLLSDMAVVDEILTAIKAHRPRCPTFQQVIGTQVGDTAVQIAARIREDRKNYLANRKTAMTKHVHAYLERRQRWTFLREHFTPDLPDSSPIRKSLEAYLRLPNSTNELSRRTIANTENSHLALDDLWATMREPRRARLQAICTDAKAIEETLDRISVGLSEKHKCRVKFRMEALILAVETKEAADRTPLQELSRNTMQLSLEKSKRDDTSHPRAQPKVKTRGSPQEIEVDPAEEVPLSLSELPPLIEVKRSSLNVFEQLFDSTPQARGNLKWTSFASAMVDAGFSMIPNSGSEVTFRDRGGMGSIVVHRPHPGNEVNCTSLAMRLEVRFYWNAGSFVEWKKASD